MEDEYQPEMSSDACFETLADLTKEAKIAAKEVGKREPDLAMLLSSLYIAQQNQMTILWHRLETIEKKIDRLSIRETKKRF